MALTCPNGHANDEGYRFCEQCGAPLQQSSASVAAPVTQSAAESGTTSSGCPVCGQENVPGTAFCDNCGTALPPPAPAATAEPSTTSAPAATSTADATSATTSTATIACPQCGVENDAANRFCDNCGATLTGADSATQTAGGPAGVAAGQPDQGAQMGNTPDAAVSAVPAPEVRGAGSASVAPTLPDVAIATSAARVNDVDAERQRLEEVIRTQRPLIEQLEQMQTNFGAATPPSIVQGLEEARQRLAQAEAALQALPTQPTADPAEVARLEEAVRTQRQLVEQLEQMQANFGAATPPSIVQGLEEARQRLAQAEAELQTLTGGGSTVSAAPTTAQPDPSTTSASGSAASSQAAVSPAPVTTSPSIDGAQQPTPVVQPQASGPRFVTRDGSAISLPRTGDEIVIGRDDPVSGIHPDVDLTPHGGEAGGVSRRHAILREQNGQWLLTDLDSTNYTRVDGNRIAPDTPTPLHDGARVQFGRLEVDFRMS